MRRCPSAKSNVYAALRSVMPADVPNCHGYTRADSRCVAPRRHVVNSVHPAPCGARGITGYRMIDCLFGALAQAVPDEVTADGTGGSTLPTLRRAMSTAAPSCSPRCFMGTWGATSRHDGQEGVPHMGANQSNVPVEMIEADYPDPHRALRLRPRHGRRRQRIAAGCRSCATIGCSPTMSILDVRSDKRGLSAARPVRRRPGSALRRMSSDESRCTRAADRCRSRR